MKVILQKEKFEQLMLMSGLSRAKLSRKCDLSETHIYRVLHGKSNITPIVAKKISDALDCPMTELFTFEE